MNNHWPSTPLRHCRPGRLSLETEILESLGWRFAASRCAHDVIVRLTKVRAERLAGRGIEPGYDRNLTWRPSRWDQCGGPYAADAAVSGRLICIPAADPNHTEAIYLFTTLDIAVNQISNLYAQRWNVETDLRSIKQTVRLQEFSARSVTGLHNELLLAFAAYNLVRAMICLAAAKANVPPRKISFTNVYALLRTFAGDIYAHRHASCHAPFPVLRTGLQIAQEWGKRVRA